jgi:hydroxyacylglutathione hydrolase
MVLFEQIVAEGLAHQSYLIGSGTDAAVIDPQRDCEIYGEIARKDGLNIRHIFETHRHEDFVIGSVELKERCGAEIWHGAALPFSYGKPVHEGKRFTVGSLELEVLETPGHTEESISLIVRDREVSDESYMIFCGDTLFAGDIARTDFYGQEQKAEMAGKIYDSIERKILTLGDGVIICPAHGAGSICGGDIADHPFTTVGYEKRTNPFIRMGKDAFVRERANESPYTPPYFRQMERFNKEGAPLLKNRFPKYLTIAEVHAYRDTGCQIVDIRPPTGFSAGHIGGSLSLWRNGLAALSGWVLDYEKPIVLIDDFNLGLDQVVRHFVRLGYDNLAGVLSGGFPAWAKAGKEVATLPTCSVHQLKERLDTETPFLLDVRDIKNWRALGHIHGAHHIYVGELPERIQEIPHNKPVIIYCDAGFKGSLAASILARNKYPAVTNVLGGLTAWKAAGFPVEP